MSAVLRTASRRPRSGSVSILRFARLNSLLPAHSDAIPVILAAGLLPAPGVIPPGGIPPAGTLPPWIRTPAPPGFYFTPPPRLAVEAPEWVEAKRLRAELTTTPIDPQTRKELELQWPWLSMRQGELLAEANVLDDQWDAMLPGIQRAVNDYIDTYWRIQREVAKWQEDDQAYAVYCSRTVTPEELDRATRECQEIRSGLQARADRLAEEDRINLESLTRDVTAPMQGFNTKFQAFLLRAQHWGDKVLAFNAAAAAAIQSARREPTAAECHTAIKILTKYKSLAEKLGRHIPPERLAALDRLRDTGQIRITDLPGILHGEFPGVFGHMTLSEIRDICRGK